MSKKVLPVQAFRKLAALYADMEKAYSVHAEGMGLTCDNCENNCCTSYFRHHTRIEWAYLLRGLTGLSEDVQRTYQKRAGRYVRLTQDALSAGERPSIMCPLNDDGRCGMYAYRLMICRLHGVPNRLRYPDGRVLDFPGCYRSQDICERMDTIPVLDRTNLYIRLMRLELQFVGPAGIRTLPKVNMTLAEMIVAGPPNF